MRLLRVRHITTYRYANPVSFGDHRMMFRPRDSHDLRLIETKLVISPKPHAVHWLHDVHGNSVGVASFEGTARELRFESEIALEHFETDEPDFPLEDFARNYPFSYAGDEMPDLRRLIERHYADPNQEVDRWARSFVTQASATDTWDLLGRITRAIQRDFAYRTRNEEGVQDPVETLQNANGSCRDLAVLMMEAVRSLGLAACFVSGYLYAPDGAGHVSSGTTHAWVQVYLPGAGWVEFDPTNGIVGNRNLIRVAVARDPAHALPLQGTWTGAPGDFIAMDVEVSVRSEG